MTISPFDKEAYNECYANSERYKQHYKDVDYFCVWKCVSDKLSENDKILDLGCGPGHLAHMLYDKGVKTFVGIDFSSVGIKMARAKVSSYTFIEADLNSVNYDRYSDFKFVSVEVFEHLKNDIEVIKKLPKNYMIFSVPNYLCVDHYRTYDNEEFISKYYKNVLEIVNIESFSMGRKNIIYVVECNIK